MIFYSVSMLQTGADNVRTTRTASASEEKNKGNENKMSCVFYFVYILIYINVGRSDRLISPFLYSQTDLIAKGCH